MLDGHRRAVATRAAAIQGERERDARRIDGRFCDTQPDDDGLVVGHWAEWSAGLERLLSAAADDAAPRMRALFGARSNRDSKGRCAWLFRREVAWAALNANAKLKVERAEFVGWDARTAGERRAQQERRENSRRERCAHASAAYERAREGMFDASRFPRQRD